MREGLLLSVFVKLCLITQIMWCADPVGQCIFQIIHILQDNLVAEWLLSMPLSARTHQWQCRRWRQPSGYVGPFLQTCTDPSGEEQCGPGHTQRWWSQNSHYRVQPQSQSLVPAHGEKRHRITETEGISLILCGIHSCGLIPHVLLWCSNQELIFPSV